MSVEWNCCERDVISTATSLRATVKEKHLKLKHVLGGERLSEFQPSKVGSSSEERVAGPAFADEIGRIARGFNAAYLHHACELSTELLLTPRGPPRIWVYFC